MQIDEATYKRMPPHLQALLVQLPNYGKREVMELFPETKGGKATDYDWADSNQNNPSHIIKNIKSGIHFGDNGSAARFFYCSKASRSERDNGCEDMTDRIGGGMKGTEDKTLLTGSGNIRNNVMKNNHPTVKPLALMEYLCKLVKMPEYNIILDPFCGSGTTLLACGNLGIHSIGIELDESSCEIAANRCAADTISRIQRGEY